MLKTSARNSICHLSPNLVFFRKLMSQLLVPGPQQMERGALPMVPGATVELVNKLGSEAQPQEGQSAWNVGCRLLLETTGHPAHRRFRRPTHFARSAEDER